MKHLKLICMLSLAVTVSCSGNKATSDDANNNNAEEITTEVVQSEFITPDLSLCDVKGHVKEISDINGDILIAKFDQDGNLLNYGNRDRISNVQRDEENRLIEFLGSEWMKIEWDGNVPASIQNTYNELTYSDTYTRDANGNIIKITYRYQDMIEDIDNTEIRTIEYGSDSFDQQGNWIKRTITYPNGDKDVQERKITYFE